MVQEISPWVIVEQQLEGFVYRATVIGGRVVGVLRREPANIIGDGKSTIKQLIIEENKTREGKKLYLLYDQMYGHLTYGAIKHYDPVSLRPEMQQYTRRGLTLRSVA